MINNNCNQVSRHFKHSQRKGVFDLLSANNFYRWNQDLLIAV